MVKHKMIDDCLAANPSDMDRKWYLLSNEQDDKHIAVLERFGRYPSRNAALGRQNTSEEEEFLKTFTGWANERITKAAEEQREADHGQN